MSLANLTPFSDSNNSDWCFNDPTNAMLLISCDSNRFKAICTELEVERRLNNITEGA